MPQTDYGDISPRTAAKAARTMLERGMPYLVLEKFGQAKPIPRNETKAITFRRYEALDKTPNALTEGVTPATKQLTKTDVTATLTQYGDLVQISDVIADTHEDPVLQESVDVLGEQQSQMLEVVRFNVLKAGTNIHYANGSATTDVNTAISLPFQRKVTRALARQNARQITKVIRSTPDYGTQAVAASFVGLCHPDMENDIREMPGFVPVESYGSMTPYESEIGKVERVRYIASTIFEPWADAGNATLNGMLGGTGVDVYPVLYISANAYGIVPLKGIGATKVMVVNPNKPSAGDPLGQRGFVGWKAYQTAVILNDLWMVVGKVGVTAL